ncbi:T9SS type A sorting domain-containing protein, partial [Calditrichota bacterium]
FYDLQYRNKIMYGVNETDTLYAFDPADGSSVARYTIPNELNRTKSIAISEKGRIFITAIRDYLYEYSFSEDGESLELERIYTNAIDPRAERNGDPVSVYGLAWFRDDPENYNLYMMHRTPNNADDLAALFKYSLATGDIILVTEFDNVPDPYNDFQGKNGICITPRWDNRYWTLAVVLDDETDGIGVFEIGPNTSWINYEPRRGYIAAASTIGMDFYLNSTDLASDEYAVDILFSHNADSGWFVMPISFNVSVSVDEDMTLPLEWNLAQNFPNPFNPTTQIDYSVRNEGVIKLTVYDIQGRQVSLLADGYRQAGRYSVTFDAAQYPAGMYIYRLEAEDISITRKMVLIK